MNKHCIYKLKEGKELKNVEYYYDRENIFVHVHSFAMDPSQDKSNVMMAFERVDPETLKPMNHFGTISVMQFSDFEQYFDLYMNHDDIKSFINKHVDQT